MQTLGSQPLNRRLNGLRRYLKTFGELALQFTLRVFRRANKSIAARRRSVVLTSPAPDLAVATLASWRSWA